MTDTEPYLTAVALTLRERRTSTVRLQRALHTAFPFTYGYNRAALLLAQMEAASIVGHLDSEEPAGRAGMASLTEE
jgi:DNA segregation ATPase FtsK/SpoIIIE-like protein